ncbi:TetR/AcrR family transcriptional regulator [Herbiconiux sp. YIM B11900]|uniref:TetR/AcrR family transcriptional regulator n=1 Tax=Herbiconiux sp. YIM B11900 TaxID=3404131 RepID=UPI003F841DA7
MSVEAGDRPRGRPRDESLRARVLAVVADQLASTGFAAMTMDGVIAESGAAKRTLYRWWPSKASLVADALLQGFIEVPANVLPESPDVWADLDLWLQRCARAMRGPYGEVLRAATAISATEPAIAVALEQAFALPAHENLVARLERGVADRQLRADADIESVVHLLLAAITYVGISRADPDRFTATLAVLKDGISARV